MLPGRSRAQNPKSLEIEKKLYFFNISAALFVMAQLFVNKTNNLYWILLSEYYKITKNQLTRIRYINADKSHKLNAMEERKQIKFT